MLDRPHDGAAGGRAPPERDEGERARGAHRRGRARCQGAALRDPQARGREPGGEPGRLLAAEARALHPRHGDPRDGRCAGCRRPPGEDRRRQPVAAPEVLGDALHQVARRAGGQLRWLAACPASRALRPRAGGDARPARLCSAYAGDREGAADRARGRGRGAALGGRWAAGGGLGVCCSRSRRAAQAADVRRLRGALSARFSRAREPRTRATGPPCPAATGRPRGRARGPSAGCRAPSARPCTRRGAARPRGRCR